MINYYLFHIPIATPLTIFRYCFDMRINSINNEIFVAKITPAGPRFRNLAKKIAKGIWIRFPDVDLVTDNE